MGLQRQGIRPHKGTLMAGRPGKSGQRLVGQCPPAFLAGEQRQFVEGPRRHRVVARQGGVSKGFLPIGQPRRGGGGWWGVVEAAAPPVPKELGGTLHYG